MLSGAISGAQSYAVAGARWITACSTKQTGETTKTGETGETAKSEIGVRIFAKNVAAGTHRIASIGSRVCMVLVGTYAAGWALKEMGQTIADAPWKSGTGPICDNNHLDVMCSWDERCPSGTLLSQADKLLFPLGDLAIGFGNNLEKLGEKMQSLSCAKQLLEGAKIGCQASAVFLALPIIAGTELYRRTSLFFSKGDVLLPTPVYNFFKRPDLPESLIYRSSDHSYVIPGLIYNSRFAEGIQRYGLWGDSWVAS